MGDGSKFSDQQPSDRRKRRHRRWYQRFPSWLDEYIVEIGMVAAVAIAVFLLLEPWNIRQALYGFARRSLGILAGGVNKFGTYIVGRLTLSDAIALVILIAVIWVAFWRLRWRLVRRERLWSTHCPRCQNPALRRIRRRWHHRFWVWLGFPFKRYYCGQCGWHGLRIAQSQLVRPKYSQKTPPRT